MEQHVGLFSVVVLSLIFATSSIGKFRNLEQFQDALIDLRVPINRTLTILVPVLEAVLCLLLLISPTMRLGLALAAGTLLVFTIPLCAALRKPVPIRCNCFGAGNQAVSRWDLVRNTLLAAIAAAGIPNTPFLTSIATEGFLRSLPFALCAAAVALILANLSDIAELARRPFKIG